MKTGILTTKTIASEDIKDTKSIMGMSSKGMEMAQYFLRDKIYSDKILAVVREYISNAWDEHKKFNIDRPVEIKMVKQSNANYMWSVRDYAMGLDEHDIRNVFGMYFESTKSQSNDAIGGFGIGGKAAFSYTDTFYVNSYHKGTLTNYVCTLGAGTKGIPVGEIYKISEEPTTEQGIEISLEVKGWSDPDTFNSKTIKLIEFFETSANIQYRDFGGNLTVPLRPINSKTVGEYTLHQYDQHPHYRGSQPFFIRMGGVIYPFSFKTLKNRSFSINSVVIDVPIGKLSIPISRESIENTPLNEKVYAEIDAILDTMTEQEIASLVVPKFGSLITGIESKSMEYKGEWFNHSFKQCFPMTATYLLHVGRMKDAEPTMNVVSDSSASKHMIYVFPNIKSTKSWHKRLDSALSKVHGAAYMGYAYLSKAMYEKMLKELDHTIDISDCCFVDIKSLKLPKLEKPDIDKSTYLVYDNYGRQTYRTAEELDAQVIKNHFNDEEQDDDWYANVEDMDSIHKRTVGKVSDYGTRSSFWTVNSIRMIESLKQLGWLTPDSQEYIETKKKFDEKYRNERIVDQAKSMLRSIYFGAKVNSNLVKIIEKKPTKIDRVQKVHNLLLKEDSTRGRILKSLSTYDQRINRQDLRKILKLKS